MTKQSTQRKEAALSAVAAALEEAQTAGLTGLVFGVLADTDTGKTQSIMVAAGSSVIRPQMFGRTIQRLRKEPSAVRLIDATIALCMLQSMMDDVDSDGKPEEPEECHNPMCPEHGIVAELMRKGKKG